VIIRKQAKTDWLEEKAPTRALETVS